MPLKSSKQSKKAEKDISGILLKVSRWVPLIQWIWALQSSNEIKVSFKYKFASKVYFRFLCVF